MFTADKRHSPHTLHRKKALTKNPSRTTCGTRDSSSNTRQREKNEKTGNLTVMTIDKKKDPMGAAILEAVTSRQGDRRPRGHKHHEPLRVLSPMFEDDELPVSHLLRTPDEMPEIERKALDMSYGKILDVGAGAGCHSLALQEMGHEVTAIDISPLCCEAMERRGIKDVRHVDLFDKSLSGKFNTILLLMNGTGIAGRLSRLPSLLGRLKEIMADDGQVLIDSSDIKYVYGDEDDLASIIPEGRYYGEVEFQMVYKDIRGKQFEWLYVDFALLETIAKSCGMKCEMILEGAQHDYLARLTL